MRFSDAFFIKITRMQVYKQLELYVVAKFSTKLSSLFTKKDFGHLALLGKLQN